MGRRQAFDEEQGGAGWLRAGLRCDDTGGRRFSGSQPEHRNAKKQETHDDQSRLPKRRAFHGAGRKASTIVDILCRIISS